MTTMIAEGLFRVDGEDVVLLGSRRASSGVVKFPAERAELFEGLDDIETVELSTHGTLYTFPRRSSFRRCRTRASAVRISAPTWWGLSNSRKGMVEGLIVGADAADLRIGQAMKSTTTTFETGDGQELLTYAFTPA